MEAGGLARHPCVMARYRWSLDLIGARLAQVDALVLDGDEVLSIRGATLAEHAARDLPVIEAAIGSVAFG